MNSVIFYLFFLVILWISPTAKIDRWIMISIFIQNISSINIFSILSIFSKIIHFFYLNFVLRFLVFMLILSKVRPGKCSITTQHSTGPFVLVFHGLSLDLLICWLLILVLIEKELLLIIYHSFPLFLMTFSFSIKAYF